MANAALALFFEPSPLKNLRGHLLQWGLLHASSHVKILGIGLHHTTIYSSFHAHGMGRHGLW